jgi:hypothetical protein
MGRGRFVIGVVVLVLLLGLSAPAHAKDYYISQSGKGSGANCSSPLPVQWFWNTGAYLGYGNTVHLCGTFYGGVGWQMLVVKSNGLTIKFESGAKLLSPAWSVNGAIGAQGRSNVTVNGNGTGYIGNTANGTGHYHQTSVAVNFGGCTGCKVEYLTIGNMYVHTSSSDTSVNQSLVNCVNFTYANGVTIDHVTCHDAGWAFAGVGNNFTLQYSTAYNIDHGVAFGANGTQSGFWIHDNHFYNFANWDTSSNTYHHDGIHMWGQNGRITNGSIYNNRFDGDSGVNITGFIFLQDSIQHVAVFNNVFNTPANRVMRSIWFEATSTSMPHGAAIGNSAHNNTVNAGTHSGGAGLMIDNQLGFSGYNNLLMGGQSDVAIRFGTTLAGLNYNMYVDLGSYGDRNTFSYMGKSYQTITDWRNACRCDANARIVSSTQAKLSTTGQVQTGSAAIGAGANLTDIATAETATLATDIIGAARPATGSWDAGAFQTGSMPARPAAVAGISASVK